MSISLRTKLILSFSVVIAICGIFATYMDIRLIGDGIIRQAQDKVRIDLNSAREIYQERLKRLPTSTINNVVQQAVASHNRPRNRRKQLKVFYATQAEVNPPTFVFFTNDASLVHFSYRRYLENKLRQTFGFDGTPLRMTFKTRGES